MWQTFIDILIYSSLGASLLTFTNITPDVVFEVASTPASVTVDETTATTLTLKTNTPIQYISGSLSHEHTLLTLDAITNEQSDYILTTDKQSDTETAFVLEAAGSSAIGILPVLTFSFSADAIGSSSVALSNLTAKTAADGSTFLTTQLVSEIVVTPEKSTSDNATIIDFLFGLFSN